MPAPMLKERVVILAKSEATYGVDPTPTVAANAILSMGTKLKENHEAIKREVEMVSLSNRQSVRGSEYTELTFQTEIIGSGSVGVAPRLGALLKACSMSETVSAGSSCIYTPASSPQTSCTLWVYIDGRRHVINGAVGTFKLIAEAGKQGLLEFNFKGLYTAPTDTALSTPTYESTIDTPAIVKSSNFLLNSVALILQKLEFDLANTIAKRDSLSASTGVAGFYVTNRAPTVTIDPEAVPIATYDLRADTLTTPRALSAQIGATAGNICTITVPKFNITDLEYADREKILVEKIKGQAVTSTAAGDDEISIKFT